jgi:hypothetical protein
MSADARGISFRTELRTHGENKGPSVTKRQILLSQYSFLLLVGATLGSASTAKAQVPPNIQSTLQIYTLPTTQATAEVQQVTTNYGACLDDPGYILLLVFQKSLAFKDLNLPSTIKEEPYNPKTVKDTPAYKYFKDHKQLAADILAKYFIDKAKEENAKNEKEEMAKKATGQAKTDVRIRNVPNLEANFRFIPPVGTPFCTTQPVALKLSAPVNPTDESNVLKSSQNNSPGTSWGYGGAAQLVLPALPNGPPNGPSSYDVIGFSAQSQSVRYNQYPLRSLDSITLQGAYQYFLGARGYDTNHMYIDSITPGKPAPGIPPNNLITVDSVAFGFQNQSAYTPGFHAETVDLFTPQVTFNRQNQDLSFDGDNCFTSVPDPRKQGFCYYADLALTFGQTFSDVATQQNANVTASATPGWRIPGWDWKLTLPMTATARDYENILGGRRDILFQVGPALSYTSPTFYDSLGDVYVASFSISATYNQNYSSIATDAWHGYIIMPMLTIAYQPALK